MGWPAASKPLHSILFECLKQPNTANTYYTSEQIAGICNHACNLVDEDGVSKELVGRALSNDSMSEYCLEFRDLVDVVDMNMTDFLHVYVSKCFSMNGKRFTAAGRFTSKEECIKASDHMINDTNRHSFRNWNFGEISVSNRLAFQEYVHSQRAGAVRPRPGRLGDIDPAAAKRLRLSNESTKAKSQIVVYKKNCWKLRSITVHW